MAYKNSNIQKDSKEITYLNKTFGDFKANLIDFAKQYFPDAYNDFNEADPGTMFIEMSSYVGDVLSFYTDYLFKENLIQYATEKSKIYDHFYEVIEGLDVGSVYVSQNSYLIKADIEKSEAEHEH